MQADHDARQRGVVIAGTSDGTLVATNADPSARGNHPRGSVLLSAALASALNPLNSTMIAVALPALSATFRASASSVTLTVVTGYLVATLVSQMPAGSIADRVGYGRALSWGRWLFCAGAVAGTFAPYLGVVIAGRLLMAAGGSLIIPTAMALVRIAVPAEHRARAFGLLGAVLGAAAAIGPAVGAWLIAHFGWRSLFIANVPVILASWLVQPAIEDARSDQRIRSVDWVGSLLIGSTLVLITFATRASAPAAYALAASGVIAFGVLIAYERRAPAPVLHLNLFGVRGFVAGSAVIATQNFAMYSLLVLVPFMFGSDAGIGARLGIAMTAMTATMALASPVGGWLVEWIGARAVVIAGGLIGAAGVSGVGRLAAGASAFDIAAPLVLVGLGLGLSTGPAQAVALSSVDRDESGVASATISMLRYLGAITGTTLLAFVLVPGAAAAPRESLALTIFSAAFLVSAGCGGLLPGIQGSGIRDQGSGIRDQGSGIRDQGSGIRDQKSKINDQKSKMI